MDRFDTANRPEVSNSQFMAANQDLEVLKSKEKLDSFRNRFLPANKEALVSLSSQNTIADRRFT